RPDAEWSAGASGQQQVEDANQNYERVDREVEFHGGVGGLRTVEAVKGGWVIGDDRRERWVASSGGKRWKRGVRKAVGQRRAHDCVEGVRLVAIPFNAVGSLVEAIHSVAESVAPVGRWPRSPHRLSELEGW